MFHSKAAEFFQLCQYGIACLGGVEKIIQCLTHCVDTHQYHPGFAVLKIDLQNAFKTSSLGKLSWTVVHNISWNSCPG